MTLIEDAKMADRLNNTLTEKTTDSASKKPYQKPSPRSTGITDRYANPVGVRSVRTSNIYTSLTHRGCQWIGLRVRSAAKSPDYCRSKRRSSTAGFEGRESGQLLERL